MASELVPVEQVDRDAAIRIMSNRWKIRHKAQVRAGEGDDWIPVQECARHRIAALEAQASRIAELEAAVIAFGAPWAVQYAREFGFPEGHLHPAHYDILAHAGARLDSFVRGDPALLGDREG